MFALLYHPAINPTILHIAGPFAIRWYSLMYIVGFLFVYLFLLYHVRKQKILMTETELSDILFIAIIGVLAGARLGYVLFYNPGYYLHHPLKVFAVWEGGMSFHGGLIFTLLLTWIYISRKKLVRVLDVTNEKGKYLSEMSKMKKFNFIDVADVFVIPVPMALFFGRWGNFVNGELWGRPTASKIGMMFTAQFPNQAEPDNFPVDTVIPKLGMTARQVAEKAGLPVAPGQQAINLPRFPSQLFEMALEGLLLFTILFLVMKFGKRKPRGIFLSIFLTGYGLARFIVEFFREPDAQLGYLFHTSWITMGQVLSLPMILLGIAGIFYFNAKNMRNELWA